MLVFDCSRPGETHIFCLTHIAASNNGSSTSITDVGGSCRLWARIGGTIRNVGENFLPEARWLLPNFRESHRLQPFDGSIERNCFRPSAAATIVTRNRRRALTFYTDLYKAITWNYW